MKTPTTQTIFETNGYEDNRIRNSNRINWIKKAFVMIRETRQFRAEYRQLLSQPDWVFDDLGLMRWQVEQAANDNQIVLSDRN